MSDSIERRAAASNNSTRNASELWFSRFGEMLTKQEVVDLLGLTSQELTAQEESGGLLALEGEGGKRYPAWQLETQTTPPSIRSIMAEITTIFRDAVGDGASYTIAAWALSPQPELEDRTPAQWITGYGDPGSVLSAAQRTAHLERV